MNDNSEGVAVAVVMMIVHFEGHLDSQPCDAFDSWLLLLSVSVLCDSTRLPSFGDSMIVA